MHTGTHRPCMHDAYQQPKEPTQPAATCVSALCNTPPMWQPASPNTLHDNKPSSTISSGWCASQEHKPAATCSTTTHHNR
mmetsp:Transcript_31732/g.80914  ORF Transcript_31732/g.80914 Transcript_31732/m.80914 type:complete len:80 (-) Transcript_31732:608-847(-)